MTPKPYNIICYDSFRYSPKYSCETKSDRPSSAFFIIKKGTYRYTFDGRTMYAHDNDLVYVPRGGSYKYEVLTELKDTFLHQVEFQIFDAKTGGVTALADHPVTAIGNCGAEVADLMEEVTSISAYSAKYNSYKMISILYMLIYHTALNHDAFRQTAMSRPINEALKYIEKNLGERIVVSEIAKMSHLSVVQFRRQFKKELCAAPNAYITTLKMKKARSLLRQTDCSIGEVAALVGYENVYYFSNAFKKKIGMSPSAYRNGSESEAVSFRD